MSGKKKKRKTWCKDAMAKAIMACRNKEMGYLKASKLFGVPKGTLEKYVKDNSKEVNVKLGRTPQTSAAPATPLLYSMVMTPETPATPFADLTNLTPLPLPKPSSSRGGTSAVITASPYKALLMASKEEANAKLRAIEEKAKAKAKKQLFSKPKKAKRNKSSSDVDSSAHVTSGESAWEEELSDSEGKDCPKWKPVKRIEDEYVVFKYEHKFFPGQIVEIRARGAVVSVMQQCGRLWKWPDSRDIIFYNWGDIVSNIEEPSKTLSSA